MQRYGAASVASLAALLLLAWTAALPRPAEAQDGAPPPASSGVPAVSTPTPLPPPASSSSTATPPSPAGDLAIPPPSAPPTTASTPALTRREQLKAQPIDQVMSRLAAIKDQQAELEKERKEAEAVLKEKLKEQKEKLKKLGVNVEEGDRTPAKLPAVRQSIGATY